MANTVKKNALNSRPNFSAMAEEVANKQCPHQRFISCYRSECFHCLVTALSSAWEAGALWMRKEAERVLEAKDATINAERSDYAAGLMVGARHLRDCAARAGPVLGAKYRKRAGDLEKLAKEANDFDRNANKRST